MTEPNAPAPLYSLRGKRVFVAGHRGMVGAALLRRLGSEDCEVLTAGRAALDLRDPAATLAFMQRERPDAIFMAAARVGGIMANAARPATFLYENLMIAASVTEAARAVGVEKMLFLGSSCIYPRDAAQPITEDALLTGPLEKTNEGYAIAKIAGLKLAETYRAEHGCDFISAMPTNLYGPGDNYDPEGSHVLPALLRKAMEAKAAGRESIEIWGTGSPRREFLHVDDCADGLVHLMTRYSDAPTVNLGCGEDVSILDLARLAMKVAGMTGEVTRDLAKPDGTPLKRLDVSRMAALGWRPSIGLEEGMQAVHDALAAMDDPFGARGGTRA